MALVLTIAGATKFLKAGTFRVSQVANARATASFTIESSDASYRPAMDAEVILTENGTRIFGGLAQRPEESGLFRNGALVGIATTLSAVDFNAYADWRAVNGTMPAGTLKDMLVIIATYLSTFGVTLDAGQVDGPDIPELTHEYMKATDVLNELMTLTAADGEPYVWEVDEFKVLRAFQPSTEAAPFDVLTNTPAQVQGDIKVASTREHYANSIIVLVPTRTELNRVEAFTGDGATTSFALNYTLDKHYGVVFHNGNNETLSTVVGDATWLYDVTTNTITRTSAAVAGAPITIQFDGTLATFGLASDAGEIAAVGYREKVVRLDSVPNAAAAQARADSELAAALAVHQTVRYRTLEDGLRPGQSQAINVPKRNVNADGMISDITIRDLGRDRLVRDVTVVIDATQTNLGKSFRDVYKRWDGNSNPRGTAVVSGGSPSTPPNQSGPGGPHKAVQYNRAGVFGGEAAFTYDEATDSVVCGEDCSITAGDPVSCQVFGSNNHIAELP
jgi:hypothetical protein